MVPRDLCEDLRRGRRRRAGARRLQQDRVDAQRFVERLHNEHNATEQPPGPACARVHRRDHRGRHRDADDADVRKALESAIANAENNHELDIDDLVVAEAFVGKGLVMKRFHARARGRGARIEKPFSHLTIVVREIAAEA